MAITAEQWVAGIGSFETGEFNPVGSAMGFGAGQFETPTLMEGWGWYGSGLGAFSSYPSGSWIENSSLAQSGNRFVSMESKVRINMDSEANVTSVDYSSVGLSLLFGEFAQQDGTSIKYGPSLIENQTYELSFWARNFGANLPNQNFYLSWDEYGNVDYYQDARVSSPRVPSDAEGNALAIDPYDPNVLWFEHTFTFTTLAGTGRFHISPSMPISLDGKIYSHVLHVDNFQLVAVPEPSSTLLLFFTFFSVFFRRSRAAQ